MSDSKCRQVSRTVLSILVDPNNDGRVYDSEFPLHDYYYFTPREFLTEALADGFPLEFIIIILFTNPSARAGYDTRSVFKRSLTGLNSEFSFSETSCLTKAEEPSLSYYLPIAGGRIIGFIPFPRVLVLCEMQSVSSRIWTRVAVSNSYDDNDYTTGTSHYHYHKVYLYY